jgi:hypothetical protein
MQGLVNVLQILLGQLRMFRRGPNVELLDSASDQWQLVIVPKLYALANDWAFEHAVSPAVEDFVRRTQRLEGIRTQLATADATEAQSVSGVRAEVTELASSTWTLLDVADKRIIKLVESLQSSRQAG